MAKRLTEQDRVLRELRSGKNVCLLGPGGVGKTSVLNIYKEECESEGKHVLVTAPTGIAALNLNGVTMHNGFGIPVPAYGHYDFDVKLSKSKEATVADVIFIDEISMCRNDVFEYFFLVLEKIKKELGRVPQVVVSGDFFQLPPVVKSDEINRFRRLALDISGYCFTTIAWKKMKFKVVEMHDVKRQDDVEFIEQLHKLRIGDKSCIKYFNKRVTDESEIPAGTIRICATNAVAMNINNANLQAIDSPAYVYLAKRTGSCAKEYPVDDTLILKVGANVIFMVNDNVNNDYQNGTLGTITECYTDNVKVRLQNGSEILVKPHKWDVEKVTVVSGITNKSKIGCYSQLPLKLADAITMHKTQGQTYDEIVVTPDSFADGQLYVALSRVKSIDGLYLTDPILPEYIKVSKKVLDFYNNGFKYDIPDTVINKKKELEKKAKEKRRNNKKKKTSPKKTTAKKTTTKKAARKKTTTKKRKVSKKKCG